MRVVDVVLWVESLADEVEAAELVEDVEAGDEVRGVGGEARGGVGEVGCFEGGDPGEAEVCGMWVSEGVGGGRGDVPYRSDHVRSRRGEGSSM